jgi:hypothetical protein
MMTREEKKHRRILNCAYGPRAGSHYYAELERQGAKCAVCGRVPKPGQRRLCQDHHAGTKQLRGVLCINCNRTLGNVKESIEHLTRLAEYLRYWQAHRETANGRRRGSGSCYHQAESRFWWIQYWRDERRYRESSRSEKIEDARALLRLRLLGGWPIPKTAAA